MSANYAYSRFKARAFLASSLAFGFMFMQASCQSLLYSEQNEPMAFQPASDIRHPASVGCESMIESFCDELFSPKAAGNLRIGVGNRNVDIYQGRTENDFKVPAFFYNSIKLKRRNELPGDFLRALERSSYFLALAEFVARPARVTMTPQQRVDDIRLSHRLQSIWDAAKEETLLTRMRKINPSFHSLRDEMIPLEEGWQLDKVRRQLLNEIATSLWAGHPNWQKVERSFQEIRDQMMSVVADLDVESEVRTRWLKRIAEVRLVLPGSLPEIADEDCATTEANAYYYPRMNVITVCAGDFNSEDIYQTLAHELSHSIDAGSNAYAFLMQSRLAHELAPIREQACRKKPLNCASWARMKAELSDRIDEWDDYEPDVPGFQQCLQKQKPSKELTEAAIEQAASREVDRAIAQLADSHVFLRLTKSKLPYPDGSWRRNPAYLNACRTDDLSSNKLFETEELVRTFFVGEYQCSNEGPERLKNAIASARALTVAIASGIFSVEGSLSSNESLVVSGYAAPPDERFADVIGSYTFARILSQTADLHNRRSLYLASSSWQCSPPSLAKHFPEEARIERQFSFVPHAFAKDRRRENMSGPMRMVLACNKDFEFGECRLPFREHKPSVLEQTQQQNDVRRPFSNATDKW